MARMSRSPGFEGSHEATSEDLQELPAITHNAVHTPERSIAEDQVAEIDYNEPGEREQTIRLRPAFVDTSTAGNVVVWGMPINADRWIGTINGSAFSVS